MAVSKATTTDKATDNNGDPVYGGPPATGPTPTVAPGDPVPDTLNMTDSEPDPPQKATTLTSPWGAKVTVAADEAKQMVADNAYTK
jgi:hypothetical protein